MDIVELRPVHCRPVLRLKGSPPLFQSFPKTEPHHQFFVNREQIRHKLRQVKRQADDTLKNHFDDYLFRKVIHEFC